MKSLRVLIANERVHQLPVLAAQVESLGHEVVGRSVAVNEVAAMTARKRPDIAIVGLGDSSEYALELISEIAREAYCPVIVILSAYDASWVPEAATRGVFAYIVEEHTEEFQSAIDITLRRFAEVKSLRGAIERRAADVKREDALAHARQRQALELHDSVVQRLVTAQLADRQPRARGAQGRGPHHPAVDSGFGAGPGRWLIVFSRFSSSMIEGTSSRTGPTVTSRRACTPIRSPT